MEREKDIPENVDLKKARDRDQTVEAVSLLAGGAAALAVEGLLFETGPFGVAASLVTGYAVRQIVRETLPAVLDYGVGTVSDGIKNRIPNRAPQFC